MSSESLREGLTEQARDLLHEVKPRLRGWMHAAVAPVSLVAGGVLLARTPDSPLRLGLAIFVMSAVLLFSVSALYHRRTWSPRTKARLRRLDHANIFVHIAGTYTAFALLFLEPRRAALSLAVVWSAALLGIAFRVCWMDSPRWMHTPVFVAAGSTALLFVADFAQHIGNPAFTLMVLGGVLYLLGGLVYGTQRPNPAPRWFGFHEVFHAFTVVAFAVHFVGLSVAAQAMA